MNRVVPITTSQTESRIRGYIAAGDIELTKEEIELIDREGKRKDLRLFWIEKIDKEGNRKDLCVISMAGMMRAFGYCLFTLMLILIFRRFTRDL
jgi:diketogulonate reductase-like aldo/keto reductase